MNKINIPNVYVALEHLLTLEHQVQKQRLSPKQAINSGLQGERFSKIRGRGLNFEEIRRYVQGDDIRNIDWNVTARTQKPHVRVFTEEKERPTYLIVDQRVDMFFGTHTRLKSVNAALSAAYIAWFSLQKEDRIGFILFNDQEIINIPAKKNRPNLIQGLQKLTELNNKLHAHFQSTADQTQLLKALQQANKLTKQSALFIIISDFSGFDQDCADFIEGMKKRHQFIALPTYDHLISNEQNRSQISHQPSPLQWPTSGQLTATYNQQIAQFNLADEQQNKLIKATLVGRLQQNDQRLKQLQIPLININFEQNLFTQLWQQLQRIQ